MKNNQLSQLRHVFYVYDFDSMLIFHKIKQTRLD